MGKYSVRKGDEGGLMGKLPRSKEFKEGMDFGNAIPGTAKSIPEATARATTPDMFDNPAMHGTPAERALFDSYANDVAEARSVGLKPSEYLKFKADLQASQVVEGPAEQFSNKLAALVRNKQSQPNILSRPTPLGEVLKEPGVVPTPPVAPAGGGMGDKIKMGAYGLGAAAENSILPATVASLAVSNGIGMMELYNEIQKYQLDKLREQDSKNALGYAEAMGKSEGLPMFQGVR